MSRKTIARLGGASAGAQRRPDIRFYRAAYDDAEGLSDEDLIAKFQSEGFASNRPINPTEFIQQALANKLLPNDFDPIGYRISRLELWGPDRPDWEAALHYLKVGQHENTDWHRPFDPNFYRELYLNVPNTADYSFLLTDYRSRPHGYGSIEEVLVRNGWSSREWIDVFDHQSYAIYNSLTEKLKTPIQRLVHFAEYGWQQLLPLSADQEPDWAYYADLVGHPFSLTTAYRIWIETGLKVGAPINERQHLRAMGLDLDAYPKSFGWRAYLEDSGIKTAGVKAGRWKALEHLSEHGVLGSMSPLPIDIEDMSAILVASAARFLTRGHVQEADNCYERALLDNPEPSIRILSQVALEAIRQNRYVRALPLLRLARDKGAIELQIFCSGAETALRLGLSEEALEWVLQGLASHPRNVRLSKILADVARANYSRAVSRHVAALQSDIGDSDVQTPLDSVIDAFAAAHRATFGDGPLASRNARRDRLNLVILANNDLPQCKFYRVDLKWQQIEMAQGITLQVFDRSEHERFRSAVATADVAIFYRLASSVELLQSIAMCRAIGVPTIYEVDDLVFDGAAYPEPLEAYSNTISENQHFGLRAGVALVRHAVTACDAAIASTECLARQMQPLVRSGIARVHRNGLSSSLATLARASTARGALSANADITLFYGSGTLAHGRDFREILLPALMQLMTEHPQIRFMACGHVEATELTLSFPGRVEMVPLILDRDAYLAQFLYIDLNLAVLSDSLFNDCKSEIKWLEAAAFGVPSVVSDVEGFRETLIDGVHVVRVAARPEAWYAALRDLILDSSRRAMIGEAARVRALELYTPEALGTKLADSLRALGVAAPTSTPVQRSRRRLLHTADVGPAYAPMRRRPRILLINVFFPPQTIGGATRVVRDQAAEFLDHYATRYELGILCSNNEETTPYQIEAYSWRGIPVWSISSPHREHMDWIPFDASMSLPVDTVLERFQPDLVHVHCIQRLSATLLQRVAERNIPYVVTVHDAWWISDHQFLTDGQGRLRMPGDQEEFETAYNPHSRADSLGRRLRLRQVLDGASAVLIVSQAFAEIYKRAGITKAVALPNGLPELPPLEQTPSAPGRVRLAHLGGINSYKGYFVLRQAVVRGQFSNIDLLVVDHAMDKGQQRQEVWGTTPVLIVPRVEQERVGTLYGQFDVLCALSLWPESYGLVAREAIHYGKWVIASSLGAIGEDVVPEENGWVIDPFEAGRVQTVLKKIDHDPDRYAQSPKSQPLNRTVKTQVDKLVEIYDGILVGRTAASELLTRG